MCPKQFPFSFEEIEITKKQNYEDVVWIHFRIQEREYGISVRRRGELRLNIFHDGAFDRDNCPFCQNGERSCPGLNAYKHSIYNYLKKQPQLRLRLLI